MAKFPSIESVKKYIKSPKEFRSKLPKHRREEMIVEKLPGYFLLAALAVSLYYLFDIVRPLLGAIFLAIILTVVFYPVYEWIKKYLKMNWLSSLITCFLVVIVILAPIAGFSLLLISEAANTVESVQTNIQEGDYDKYIEYFQPYNEEGFFADVENLTGFSVNVQEFDVKGLILEQFKDISTTLDVSTEVVNQGTKVLTWIFNFFLNFFIMIFSMFYFFIDGPRLLKKLAFMSPLPQPYQEELHLKLASMIKAIIFGVFLTALVQGTLGGIGFAIIGLSGAVFWGAVMAFLSLIPMVGTVPVWGLAGIIQLVSGNYWQGLFIILWGMFIVGTSDNILRPYFIGGKAKTYPLVTFFVILGGIFTIGVQGIIVGPLVLMIVLSLLHIYEAEYKKVLKG